MNTEVLAVVIVSAFALAALIFGPDLLESRWRTWAMTGNRRLRIYVCSPFAGADENMNVDFARRICRELSLAGAVVFAPHLFFTTFLNDQVLEERNTGIENGREIMSTFHEVWFVLPSWRKELSTGMCWDEQTAKTLYKRRVYALTEAEFKKKLAKLRDEIVWARGK